MLLALESLGPRSSRRDQRGRPVAPSILELRRSDLMARMGIRFDPRRNSGALTMTLVGVAICGTPALTACRDTLAPGSIKLHALTPTRDTGTVGALVTPSPTVEAIDTHGDPVAGVRVTYSVVGGASTVLGSVLTGGDGVARIDWRLDTLSGEQRLIASADRVGSSVTFYVDALPGVPTSIRRVEGDGQLGVVGFALFTPIRVAVVDAYGNGVPGASVAFENQRGGGSVSSASATTDSAGIAKTWWILGQTGTNELRASTPGIGEVSYSATASEVPPPVAGTMYELEVINLGCCDVDPLKPSSWIVLGDEGRFTMYAKKSVPLLVQGTYTVVGTSVELDYADSAFLSALEEDTGYRPRGAGHGSETAQLIDVGLYLDRCLDDDDESCGLWTYKPAVP